MSTASRTATVEVMVGVLVFSVLILLGVFTIVLSENSIFAKKYPVTVYFNSVSGLRDGDNVLLRGVKVGIVKNIDILEHGVLLHFTANQPITLYEDYRISIQSSSALGGKFLNIYEGSVGKPEVKSGTTLRGDDPVVLMDDAAELLHEIRIALKEGGALENLRIGMQNLVDISGQIKSGEGTIGKLVNNEDVYNDIKDITSEMKSFTAKLNSGDGTLAKLVNEGDTYTRLNKVLEDLNTVTEKLAKGEGTIGKLTTDDELYVEVKKLVAELRAGIDDMREASPVTTFSSVMLGAF